MGFFYLHQVGVRIKERLVIWNYRHTRTSKKTRSTRKFIKTNYLASDSPHSTTMVKILWLREEVWFMAVAPVERLVLPDCITWSISVLERRGEECVESVWKIWIHVDECGDWWDSADNTHQKLKTNTNQTQKPKNTSNVLDHKAAQVLHINPTVHILF